MPIIDPFDTPSSGGKTIVDPFEAAPNPAPGFAAEPESAMQSPAERAQERKGYRSRLAGVGEMGPGVSDFSKPALEGGLGMQALGVLQGAPFAPYAAIAGLPGVNRVLPSGEKVMETIYGKGQTPAETSGRESGMMLGMGPVAEFAIPAALKAGETAITAAGKTVPAFKAAGAVEKGLAPATSVSAVGEKLEQKIGNRLDQLVQTRRKEFEGVKDAYFEAGRQAEAPILNDYTRSIQEFYAKNADRLSVDERNLLKKSLDRLADRPVSLTEREAGSVAPGFDAIEKERRFLDDVAKGLKVEGAEAIPAMFAKDLSKMLETSIQRHVPKEFDQFNQVYKTLSEPINRYNTALGQAVTKTADEYLPQVAKIDPAKIPDKFFSSRRSINELRAMTGDEKFVQQVAREHVANDLRDVKKAEQIKTYLQKNYDWLQELPELRKDLEKVVDRVKTGEGIKTLGKYGIPALIGVTASNKIGKFIGD
jgi:hypothetical protein